MKSKIFDCITFFDNNFMFDLRYNILKDFVDYFIICESIYDHRGNPKKINFIKKKEYNYEKVKHIVLEKKFPINSNIWENQAIQREFLLNGTDDAKPEDYIFFSDPDEMPNPKFLKNFELKKKYGIFMQRCFNYKFNLFNEYESTWEGTRVSKKKNLKSIDFMRQKVLSKNLKKIFKFNIEKSIEIIKDGGWHFNNIMSAKQISLKLRTFAHSEFSGEKFSTIKIIENKIKKKKDLFERGHIYKKMKMDQNFPEFLLNNKQKYKKFIL